MPSNVIGTERSTAVYQLLGVVYLFTIFPFVLMIGLIGGLVYMISDVTLKLMTNRDVESYGQNKPASFSMRLFMWPIDQLRWVATGDDSFPFMP